MSEGRLRGVTVLVLEDDYYLADDAAQTLAGAGALVLGPCRDGEDAVALAEQEKPNCALVDINLGVGPAFGHARALLAQGVRVIFLTGYDREVIPHDLAQQPCLQKPVDARVMVAAIEGACRI